MALWGRVILGERGIYRAQYAYPVALWHGLAANLADVYKVPVVAPPTTTGEVIAQVEWAQRSLRPAPV